MVKLFVVGYPLDIQDSELAEMFSLYGVVHSIELITDKYTQKHKGFGYIEMTDQVEAERAISRMNGKIINGRKIKVKLADENRDEQPRVFRGNRFPSLEENTDQTTSEPIKAKRPRKLVSDK